MKTQANLPEPYERLGDRCDFSAPSIYDLGNSVAF